MIAYPFDRRTGSDRRSGKDRRQAENGMYVPPAEEQVGESASPAAKQAEPRMELSEVWNRKGEDLFGQGEYDKAKHAFTQAVQIKPEFALGWYNLAKVHAHKGERDQAVKKLKKAVKLEPVYNERVKTENLFKKLRGEKEFDKLLKA
jgi:tetratricopeptide (TPR) repeat protein